VEALATVDLGAFEEAVAACKADVEAEGDVGDVEEHVLELQLVDELVRVEGAVKVVADSDGREEQGVLLVDADVGDYGEERELDEDAEEHPGAGGGSCQQRHGPHELCGIGL